MVKSFTYVFKIATVCIVLVYLPGCRQDSSNNSLKKKQPQSLQYVNVKVDGVECALCAQAAVNALKTVEGVQDASYYVHNNEYEQGHVQLVLDGTQAVPYDSFELALKPEGFSVQL